MGQNKLENQIKEQLNSREIQPSAQAWDRLDAMLSVAEEKKTKRSFGWFYIAAAITVLGIAGIFFLSQESAEIHNQNTVVGTETNKDSVGEKANPDFQIPNNEKEENQVATTENQSISNQNQFQSPPEAQPNSLERSGKNQKAKSNQSSINQNQSINPNKQNASGNGSDVAVKDAPKTEDRKEAIANRPINTKSDEELLASLDSKARQSTGKTPTVKVDPRSLLSQVDGELDMTFREKVISKVAKNYKEVKVALANRNNE